MHETSIEKETPKPRARQSTKGTIGAKCEAAVSGGVMGTEDRDDQGERVRGGGLTVSTKEFFLCVL